jgi:membrane associated rhomboid family serine protease
MMQSANLLPGKMPTEPGIIPTRSKRQALDWSLVLASQAIDCTILRNEEKGWFLSIEPAADDRARLALSQYVQENRAGRWRSRVPVAGLIFHWGVLLWCSYLGLIYWFDERRAGALQPGGVMDNQAVWGGDWWRLFTAVNLHSNLGHLVANLTTGFLLLGLAMAQYGAGPALLGSYLGGAFGNVAGLIFYPQPYQGLGASGMVMAGLGLLAVQSVRVLRHSSHRGTKYLISGLFSGVLLFVLLGLDPNSDVLAHLGGFVGGVVVGALFNFVPHQMLSSVGFNFVCSILFAAVQIASWGQAFAAHPLR